MCSERRGVRGVNVTSGCVVEACIFSYACMDRVCTNRVCTNVGMYSIERGYQRYCKYTNVFVYQRWYAYGNYVFDLITLRQTAAQHAHVRARSLSHTTPSLSYDPFYHERTRCQRLLGPGQTVQEMVPRPGTRSAMGTNNDALRWDWRVAPWRAD